MDQNKRKILLDIFMFFDVLVLSAAFLVAAWYSFYSDSGTENLTFSDFLSMRISIRNFILFAILLFCWHKIFSAHGLYQSRRLSTLTREAIDILKCLAVSVVLLLIAGYLVNISFMDERFVAMFILVSATSLIISRVFLRYFLRTLRLFGHNLRYIVIVGTSRAAIEFSQQILSKPELGLRVIGFVDDEIVDRKSFEKYQYKLVADFNSFPEYIRENSIDEIMILTPLRSHYDHISEIIATAEEQGIIVRFPNTPFSLKIGNSSVDEFADEAMTTVYTGAMQNSSFFLKRLVDICLSAILLILLSPVFLLTAIAIKLDSPGPVFFKQTRLGLNKRLFQMYKFRSMQVNAEVSQQDIEHMNESEGPVFKIKNDPRITRVGSFIRKTSIDELPQLLNVLFGNMSLVGPRPLPIRDYKGFNMDWHRRRFSVKPGITCLWQVSGRSNLSFDQWMKLDMDYIDHWSLWLDMKILFKTISVVLKGEGAV